jgi:hypothetical protein
MMFVSKPVAENGVDELPSVCRQLQWTGCIPYLLLQGDKYRNSYDFAVVTP